MFVTAHATNRVTDRLAPRLAEAVLDALERIVGEPGTVAYVVAQLTGKAYTRDGSNGELVVGVAVDGSIETIYFRRASQDMSPEFFGARKVVDLRGE